jgi:hypothetical protein
MAASKGEFGRKTQKLDSNDCPSKSKYHPIGDLKNLIPLKLKFRNRILL